MKPIGFTVQDLMESAEYKNGIPSLDFQHVLIDGATGSGKTASMILPTLEDRMRRGHCVVFFDHKGHEHKKVKHLAKKAGRLEDVIEIGKPHAAGINLLAEIVTSGLKDMIKQKNESDTNYWTISSANLVEDIFVPLAKLHSIVKLAKENIVFDCIGFTVLKKLNDFGIDIFKSPSFQTLSLITGSPEKLIEYKEILLALVKTLEAIFENNDDEEVELHHKQKLFAKIISLHESLSISSRFTLSESSSDTNSGNNGVLQVLDNLIASYAKKDYVNRADHTLAELMDNNAIIIVDTQSFSDDVLKLFFESLLKKAVKRLRTGTNQPMSVFIDEANRVLHSSMDLHADVLREASVELILAIQNEEQMINKFSLTVWESIKHNIKHQYFIDLEHRISYRNNNELMKTKPIEIEPGLLLEAEYAYYSLEKNKETIKKHFLGKSDILLNDFMVIYDLDIFESESAICIKNRAGEEYDFEYYGEEIINKVKNSYPDTKEEHKPSAELKQTRAIKCLELKFLDEDPLKGSEEKR
ncbi:MAG: type IV secretory system conjugative DNA transfer family protein [Epsilonproteobacteria bacterium]|nr:type IV secretory system conjugative DNA transfer family protein [Campylobacterota bacterium]